MTPKEAFEKLVKNISVSTDEETWKLLTEDSKYPLKQLEEYKLVVQALTELEELKRYPTSDEVCEALNKWYSEVVDYVFIHGVDDFTYDVDSKRFYKRMLNSPHEMTICRLDTNNCIQFREPLPPSLTTFIGRFYEGVEKVGKEE